MPEAHGSIGGYFGLEPGSGRTGGDADHLGPAVVRLNSGRNALCALLLTLGVRRVHLPEYICASLVQAVTSVGVEPVFYPLDGELRPLVEPRCGADELWVGVNYFGLLDAEMRRVAATVARFAADNCQAFHAPPVPRGFSFYSPRKFFGVPDGGYLVGTRPQAWPADDSGDRLEHLNLRRERRAAAGYAAYRADEAGFADLPIRSMSPLTQTLLATSDQAAAAARRRANFAQLNAALGSENGLAPAREFADDGVPLVYPLLHDSPDLRPGLRDRGIFTATYWADCLDRSECGAQTRRLVQNLIALPIDQRYGAAEMERVIAAVQQLLAGRKDRLVVT